MLDPNRAFLGEGWAFPAGTAAGDVAMAAYDEDVREAILIILQTNRGERLMRPDFGAGLREFVFEPINSTTMNLVQRRVLESIVDWEPRVDVNTVEVTLGNRDGELRILLEYTVRATNTKANLVYPFYLEEGNGQ